MDEASQQRRVEALVRRLGHPERRWRWQSTLQRLGELWNRRQSRGCLRVPGSGWPSPFLASEDAILRVHAVFKVRDSGKPVPALHARLLELLEDGSPFVRAEAAAYLTQREVLTPEALRPWLARQPAAATRHLVVALCTGGGHTRAMLRELAGSEDVPTRTRAVLYLRDAPADA